MINTNIISKKMSLIAVLVITSLCAVQMSFGKAYTFTNSTTSIESRGAIKVALHFDDCGEQNKEIVTEIASNASKTVDIPGQCTLIRIEVKPSDAHPAYGNVAEAYNVTQKYFPYQSIFDGSYAGSGIWIINGKFGNYSLRNSKGQAWPQVK